MSINNDVAQKVLQRAEISRITRTLQSRLTLACYKQQRGWQNLDLKTIEPKIAKEQSKITKKNKKNGNRIKTHKPRRSGMMEMPTSLSMVQHNQYMNSSSPTCKSPTTPPSGRNRNRNRDVHTSPSESILFSSLSPSSHRNRLNGNTTSHNNGNTNELCSSPPSTPPSQRIGANNNNNNNDQQQGADLLMFLATSPSPASSNKNRNPGMSMTMSSSPPYSSPTGNGPKTPTKSTPNGKLFSHNPSTPTNFNPNDYLNISSPSPSPAKRYNATYSNMGSSKLYFSPPGSKHNHQRRQSQDHDVRKMPPPPQPSFPTAQRQQ